MLKAKKFGPENDGATAVEYALMAAILAVTIVACIPMLGDPVLAAFSRVGSLIGQAFP